MEELVQGSLDYFLDSGKINHIPKRALLIITIVCGYMQYGSEWRCDRRKMVKNTITDF